MKSINDVINMIKEWKGKKIEIKELTEGLTNKNYKLTLDNKSYVVRIPGEGSDLFIKRKIELKNTLSAAETGIGAQVYKYFLPDYIIISEFINGKVMDIESFKDKNLIVKAIKSIKKVNTEASFKSSFIMFDKFETYLNLVKKNDIKLPEKFDDAIAIVGEVKEKFIVNMPPLVACHNDLLAGNFINQSEIMRIIDWELSGMNDPCFELGDFSVEQEFGENEDALIVETYFDNFDKRMFARMNIYKSMADMLWTLWAVIQNYYSNISFDYWNYGINRFNRAMDAMNKDTFKQWLKIAKK